MLLLNLISLKKKKFIYHCFYYIFLFSRRANIVNKITIYSGFKQKTVPTSHGILSISELANVIIWKILGKFYIRCKFFKRILQFFNYTIYR